MAPNGTDTTAQQYGPNESQYIPPLETWPPQNPSQGHPSQGHPSQGYPTGGYDIQAPAAPAQPSVVVPWLFVGLGLLIPLSALIVGIWAWTRSHSDNRYTHIMIAGFAVFALMIFINFSAAGLI